MAKRNQYVEYLLEQLADLGTLRAKAMFGGYGFYCDEIFFAIVVNDILYIKADAQSKEEFTRLGLAPFSYHKKDGTPQSMAYYPPPDTALEEPEEMIIWAKKGIAAALRQR
ncbi:TfoX/Sxy family protein [Iodobacter sp. CM08]|uniref:TfoX/Sxy family protein n=1 Tax=Iodobacter sp. CM08 TaxID=3085902 RepID=UPI002980DB68|nr:TfoX/Sxy family protein [Iodobacter sp. CM08]MDW5415415.1 TfoX/Sxy family protein [Iodobacter sp. CM08]